MILQVRGSSSPRKSVTYREERWLRGGMSVMLRVVGAARDW